MLVFIKTNKVTGTENAKIHLYHTMYFNQPIMQRINSLMNSDNSTISMRNYYIVNMLNTVFRQINAPCALTETLVNSRGPGEDSRVFSAIFANFWPI